MSTPAVVLAAGGTGGHIFPAKALAEILAARGITPILLTDGRGEALEVAGRQLAVHRIAAKSPSGSLSARIRGAGALALGTLQAHFLLRRLAPLAVVGFGGFPSVPAVVAADWRRLPIVIHEQNAVLGRANRLLASRAWRIATAFEKVAKTPANETAKLRLVGNPVRPAITQLRAQDFHAPQPGEELSILVTGGSQGATVFANIVPAAAASLPAEQRRRLRIVQQARPEDIPRVRAAYADAGISADVDSFFVDMPARLADCHLMICRAGASTMAELTNVGRPAVLVPYPHAMDDHQSANAEAAGAEGAAWIMPQPAFTVTALASRLEMLLSLPERLTTAAKVSHRLGRPDAAERLADLVLEIANRQVSREHVNADTAAAAGLERRAN
jgi:UDP-N-acetylglucosamine--N-acetylmuramyl-(pentapeptide) pyrophosphoryl-undecaprenol N-acetylglucosamine transferase